jgi:DNA-binding HxlR family transcriptional regulator
VGVARALGRSLKPILDSLKSWGEGYKRSLAEEE